MSEPTKGPYEPRKVWGVWMVFDHGRNEVATLPSHCTEADAHLLAASWDMREALRYAVDNPNFDSETFDTLARAALAKSRGEAQ